MRLNATDSPGTGLPPAVSVAVRVAVPPKVPVASVATVLVACAPATSLKQTCTLESEGVTLELDVLRNAS